MKRINDLSVSELAKMSDDDFAKLVKWELICKGIPINMPEKPKSPDKFNIKPISKAYKIDKLSCYFKDRDEAIRVMDFLNNAKRYSLDNNWSISPVRKHSFSPDSKCSLSEDDVYLKEDVDKLIDKNNSEECKKYDKDLELYEDIVSKYNDAISELRNRRSEAIREDKRLNNLLQLFRDEYYPLAQDENTAIEYFKKAFVLSKEDEAYILSNYKK